MFNFMSDMSRLTSNSSLDLESESAAIHRACQ